MVGSGKLRLRLHQVPRGSTCPPRPLPCIAKTHTPFLHQTLIWCLGQLYTYPSPKVLLFERGSFSQSLVFQTFPDAMVIIDETPDNIGCRTLLKITFQCGGSKVMAGWGLNFKISQNQLLILLSNIYDHMKLPAKLKKS